MQKRLYQGYFFTPFIKPLTKISASFVLSLFVATSLVPSPSAFAAGALPDLKLNSAPALVRELPVEQGHVTNWQLMKTNPNGPFVIHIQDAHANASAQESIRKILHWIDAKSREQGLSLAVAIEGASGKIHPEYFDLIPGDLNAGKAAVKKLAAQGELSGADLFAWDRYLDSRYKPSASKTGANVYGAENPELYADNLKSFRRILYEQNKIEGLLVPIRAALEREASRVLSPALRAFLKERRLRKLGDYGSGVEAPQWDTWLPYLAKSANEILSVDLDNRFEQIRFPQLVRILTLQKLNTSNSPDDLEAARHQKETLLRKLKKIAINTEDRAKLSDFSELEKSLNPRAAAEAMVALADKYRLPLADYPAFWKQTARIILSAEIEIGSLALEMDQIESAITDKLAVEPAEKELVQTYAQFALLEELLKLEMPRDHFDALKTQSSQVGFLMTRDYLQKSVSQKLVSYEKAGRHFYEGALERDQTLVSQALKQQKAGGVVVLISGGFHTRGIEDVLRSKDASFAVVRPAMSKTDNGEAYHRVLKEYNAELPDSFKQHSLNKQQAIFLKSYLTTALSVLAKNKTVSKIEIAKKTAAAINQHPVLKNELYVKTSELDGSVQLMIAQQSQEAVKVSDKLVQAVAASGLMQTPRRFARSWKPIQRSMNARERRSWAVDLRDLGVKERKATKSEVRAKSTRAAEKAAEAEAKRLKDTFGKSPNPDKILPEYRDDLTLADVAYIYDGFEIDQVYKGLKRHGFFLTKTGWFGNSGDFIWRKGKPSWLRTGYDPSQVLKRSEVRSAHADIFESLVAIYHAKTKIPVAEILEGKMLNIAMETRLGGQLEPVQLVTTLRNQGVDIVGLDPQLPDDPARGYYTGIVQKIPFPKHHFKTVVSFGLWDPGYLNLVLPEGERGIQPFYDAAVAEIDRVLEPGGLLFLAAYFRAEHPKVQYLLGLLNERGYEIQYDGSLFSTYVFKKLGMRSEVRSSQDDFVFANAVLNLSKRPPDQRKSLVASIAQELANRISESTARRLPIIQGYPVLPGQTVVTRESVSPIHTRFTGKFENLADVFQQSTAEMKKLSESMNLEIDSADFNSNASLLDALERLGGWVRAGSLDEKVVFTALKRIFAIRGDEGTLVNPEFVSVARSVLVDAHDAPLKFENGQLAPRRSEVRVDETTLLLAAGAAVIAAGVLTFKVISNRRQKEQFIPNLRKVIQKSPENIVGLLIAPDSENLGKFKYMRIVQQGKISFFDVFAMDEMFGLNDRLKGIPLISEGDLMPLVIDSRPDHRNPFHALDLAVAMSLLPEAELEGFESSTGFEPNQPRYEHWQIVTRDADTDERLTAMLNESIDAAKREFGRSEVRLSGSDFVALDKMATDKLTIEGVHNLSGVKDEIDKLAKLAALNPTGILIRSNTKVTDAFLTQLKTAVENSGNTFKLEHVIRLGHGLDNVTFTPDKFPQIKVRGTKGSAQSISALALRMTALAAERRLQHPAAVEHDQAPVESFLPLESFRKASAEKIAKRLEAERALLQTKSDELLVPVSTTALDSLHGRVVGVIGAGNIGEELIARYRELGLEVWVNSRTMEGNSSARPNEKNHRFAEKDEIYQSADFVVVLTGLNAGTKGMIGDHAIELMSNNPDLKAVINPDRGKIVDESAMARLLKRKDNKVLYLLDDVPDTDILRSLALYTDHIGGTTAEAENSIRLIVDGILTELTQRSEVRESSVAATAQIRVAQAQINVLVGDLVGNYQKILDAIQKAKAAGADMIVFPEQTLTGYPAEDLLLKKHFIRQNQELIQMIAKQVHGITAVVGFVDSDEKPNYYDPGRKGNLYNSAAVISDGKVQGVYHKHDLPNYSVFDDKRHFSPGTQNPIFKIKGIPFAVNICEDIWIDGGVFLDQAKRGAKFLINPSASPFRMGVGAEREELLRQRVEETGVPIVYTNVVGGQDEVVYDGHSFIMGKDGSVKARSNSFADDFTITDLVVDVPADHSPVIADIVDVGEGWSGAEDRPILPVNELTEENEIEVIYKGLVLATRDYIHKNGFSKVVFGNSGGIDSALVGALAAAAFGSENVEGISMPTRFNSKETKNDARLLAENLGIRFREEPIGFIFESALAGMGGFGFGLWGWFFYKLTELLAGWFPEKSFAKNFLKLQTEVPAQNLQARIRGNRLMFYSNQTPGVLLLSTGNKSENAMGYATLYGDMAGGFAPIKDIPKSIVFKLSRYINQKAGRELIPVSIIDRPPSAELAPNQKDTDSLPPYETVLDPIIEDYLVENLSMDEIVAKHQGEEGFSEAVVRRVVRTIDRNEYKRRQGPPGPKMTRRALNRDRRMPISNGYHEESVDDFLNSTRRSEVRMTDDAAREKIAQMNLDRPKGYPERSFDNPVKYTAPSVIKNARSAKNPQGWAYPNLDDPKMPKAVRKKLIAELRADVLRFAPNTRFDQETGLPVNVNETGLNGRGRLGRYGPNPAEDPIVLRYNKEGNLELLAIERGDGGGMALPGGMIERGQENQAGVTATRELKEEANADIDMTKGVVVYEGPVDEWRNTNQAWMVTRAVAVLLSYEESKQLKIKAGSDAKKKSARFVPVTDEMLGKMYANHSAMVRAALDKVNQGQLLTAQQKVIKKYDRVSISLPDLEEAYQAFREGQYKVPENFDLVAPEAPHGGQYLVAAGLEEALADVRSRRFTKGHIDALRKLERFSEEFLKYLQNFIFEGDIDAVKEGTVLQAGLPLMRIKATPVEMHLMKSLIQNRIGFSTNIATKTARIAQAANGDFVSAEALEALRQSGLSREQIKRIRALIDFGQRRAQGKAATVASRAAIIGGAMATSNVKAAKQHYLEPSGTMAHLFITSFPPEQELEAFRLYAKTFPKNTVLLIDTYNTIEGAKNAIIVAKEMAERGESLLGVRLDSGDLVALSKEVRRMFDEAGLHDVKIVASDDLDEFKITELLEKGAQIDFFGVGTNLITGGKQAHLDLKWEKSDDTRLWRGQQRGQFSHYVKTPAKRIANAAYSEEMDEILVPFWRAGQRVSGHEKPWKAHERALRDITKLKPENKTLRSTESLPVQVQDNALSIDPATDAVLVIDAQKAFMKRGGLTVAGGDDIMPSVRAIMNLFSKDKRFASIDRHPRGSISWASSFVGFPPFTYLTYDMIKDWKEEDRHIAEHALFSLDELKAELQKIGGQMLWPDHATEGTDESELHESLRDREFAHIEIKGMDPKVDSYSAFFDNAGNPTQLAGILKAAGIKRLFIVGLAMDYCVGFSAEGAVKNGFEVVVVPEASRSVNFPAGSEDKMFASFQDKGIGRADVKDFLAANRLEGVRPARQIEPVAHPTAPREDENVGLEEDAYHLTMGAAVVGADMADKPVTFDYFFRTAPYGEDKIIVSGLQFMLEEISKFHFTEEDIDYLRTKTKFGFSEAYLEKLRNFKFTGTIEGLPEGSVAYGREPILRVKGTFLEAMIVETFILKTFNFNSLIATYANKIRREKGETKRLVLDALAGAQGVSYEQAEYSAFIGGINATTDLDSHLNYGIPLASKNDEGEKLGADFITGGPKASLGGVYKLAVYDGEDRMKLSENPIKSSLPGDKEVLEIRSAEGQVRQRLIAVEGERPKRGKGDKVYRLFVPLVSNGEVVYRVPDIWDIQDHRENDVLRTAAIHAVEISPKLQRAQAKAQRRVSQRAQARSEVRLVESELSDDEVSALKGAADNALQAGLDILAKYDAKSVPRERKLDMSWVTEADQAIQQAVIASIQRAFPDHYVLGEETLDTSISIQNESNKNSDYVWILDPIDGTRVFLEGSDDFAVSLALYYKGRPVLARTYSPYLQGTLGLNQTDETQPAALSNFNADPFSRFTGIVAGITERPAAWREKMAELLREQGVRPQFSLRVGSTVVRSLKVIQDDDQLYVDLRQSPPHLWDVAAVAYLLEKSGALALVWDEATGQALPLLEAIHRDLTSGKDPRKFSYPMIAVRKNVWDQYQAALKTAKRPLTAATKIAIQQIAYPGEPVLPQSWSALSDRQPDRQKPYAAVFDIHGVLLEPTWKRQFAYAYQRLMGGDIDAAMRWVETHAAEDLKLKLIEISGKSETDVKDLLTRLVDEIPEVRYPPVIPGALELVNRLQEAGVPVIVMSGSNRGIILDQIKKGGFVIPDENVMGRDDMALSAPDRQYVRGTRERALQNLALQFPGHQILHFTDSKTGVATVRAMDGLNFGMLHGTGAVERAANREILSGVDVLAEDGLFDPEQVFNYLRVDPILQGYDWNYAIAEDTAAEISNVLPAARPSPIGLHVEISDDLRNLAYLHARADSTIFLPDGRRVSYPADEVQLAAFPSGHLVSPIRWIEERLPFNEIEAISQLWARGQRYTTYDGITVSWDQSVDRDVWTTNIDTVYIHRMLESSGILRSGTIRRAVELGTGGGHLSTMLAARIPELRDLSISDISLYALRTAKRNILPFLGSKTRLRTFFGKGFGAIGDDIDLLVVNPPYIPTSPFDTRPHQDPYRGTGLIREVVLEGSKHLNPNNPNASIFIGISSLAQHDFARYVREAGDAITLQLVGTPIEVPLKIRSISKEWIGWLVSEGLLKKKMNFERGEEEYWHTLQVYRLQKHQASEARSEVRSSFEVLTGREGYLFEDKLKIRVPSVRNSGMGLEAHVIFEYTGSEAARTEDQFHGKVEGDVLVDQLGHSFEVVSLAQSKSITLKPITAIANAGTLAQSPADQAVVVLTAYLQEPAKADWVIGLTAMFMESAEYNDLLSSLLEGLEQKDPQIQGLFPFDKAVLESETTVLAVEKLKNYFAAAILLKDYLIEPDAQAAFKKLEKVKTYFSDLALLEAIQDLTGRFQAQEAAMVKLFVDEKHPVDYYRIGNGKGRLRLLSTALGTVRSEVREQKPELLMASTRGSIDYFRTLAFADTPESRVRLSAGQRVLAREASGVYAAPAVLSREQGMSWEEAALAVFRMIAEEEGFVIDETLVLPVLKAAREALGEFAPLLNTTDESFRLADIVSSDQLHQSELVYALAVHVLARSGDQIRLYVTGPGSAQSVKQAAERLNSVLKKVGAPEGYASSRVTFIDVEALGWDDAQLQRKIRRELGSKQSGLRGALLSARPDFLNAVMGSGIFGLQRQVKNANAARLVSPAMLADALDEHTVHQIEAWLTSKGMSQRLAERFTAMIAAVRILAQAA